jgi:hypothetical protein
MCRKFALGFWLRAGTFCWPEAEIDGKADPGRVGCWDSSVHPAKTTSTRLEATIRGEIRIGT